MRAREIAHTNRDNNRVAGTPVIVNSDNGATETRILDFSKTLEDGSLKPGQRTRAKRLEIRLEGMRWPAGVSGLASIVQLVQLRTKVLAAPTER
jgi:hypothetical protein